MDIKELLFEGKEWIKRVFLYPRKSINFIEPENYDEYWAEKRGDNIGSLSAWQEDRANLIIDTLKVFSGPIEIADIGCGDGSILFYLKKKIVNVTKLTGYDSSKFALGRAKEFGISVEYADVSDSAGYDIFKVADYYLLLEILEHIPHSEALLFAALTKSKKGVFFSLPNTGYLTHRIRMLFGKFPLQWRIVPSEHVRFWTYADLKWWLKALKINNCKIYCYRGVPILNKIFPSLFCAGFLVYIKK